MNGKKHSRTAPGKDEEMRSNSSAQAGLNVPLHVAAMVNW